MTRCRIGGERASWRALPCRGVASLMLLLWTGSATGCHGSGDVPDDRSSSSAAIVHLDSSTWSSAPRLELRSAHAICGHSLESRCPAGEIVLGGVRPDGAILLATRSGAAFVRDGVTPTFRQIGFEGNQGSTRGFGGAVDASGDTAWWLHLPDAPAIALINDSGRVLSRESAPFRLGYTGSSMRSGLFVRLVVPGGDAPGDTVSAEFEVTAPAARFGEVLATVRQPSSFVNGSSDVTLAPFFRSAPIWRLGADEQVVFCEPAAYRIDWIGSRGHARRLVVDAPRRAVTELELDALAARFRAGMPQNNPRFLAAVDADLARRRRDASRFHPAVTDLRIDVGGGTWVRGAPDAETDSVRWDIFGADLSLRGALMLDATDELLVIESDRVLLSQLAASGARKVGWFEIVGAR